MTSAVTVSALASTPRRTAADHPRSRSTPQIPTATRTALVHSDDARSVAVGSVTRTNAGKHIANSDTLPAHRSGNYDLGHTDPRPHQSRTITAAPPPALPAGTLSMETPRTTLSAAALQTILAKVVDELNELTIDARLAERMPHARTWLAEIRLSRTRLRALAQDLCAFLGLPPLRSLAPTPRSVRTPSPPDRAR